MFRLFSLSITTAALLFTLTTAADARKAPPPQMVEAPGTRVLPPGTAPTPTPPWRITNVDTTLLGEWTFDDGMGGPDPQGWTMVDGTEQIGTFFHVDDFAGLGGGAYTPIGGTKSLWCGARPCAIPEVCSYETLPGYGNNWDQMFESVAFPVTGDVILSYCIRYDVEPNYDFVYVQYQSPAGPWTDLKTYTGSGEACDSVAVSADSLAGSVSLRFRFKSDNVWSDEDGLWNTNGAAILDNLAVRDDTGQFDYQTFESEAVGAGATADGHWSAGTSPAFGNYASLFDGSGVLQEDTLFTNTTHFWGFFNGSPDTYACGGHPEQAAVPFSRVIDGDTRYINNEIRSPVIPVNVTLTLLITLSFDVYRDLPLDNLVFYEWGVRSRVGGVWQSWKSQGYVYHGAQKTWVTMDFAIGDLVDKHATDMQVRIGVVDKCDVWCGSYGSGNCHSHAPLIDNVRLVAVDEIFVVTTAASSGPGSLYQAIVDANATPTPARIQFNIPGAGPHTISVLTFPAIIAPVTIDGRTQPGYAGEPLIQLEPPYPPYQLGCFTVNAPRTAIFDLALRFYGLEYGGVGITLNADNCIVQGCTIGASGRGIEINGNSNLVGGVAPGEANRIGGCPGGGVYVASGSGNTIRGNSIDNNDYFVTGSNGLAIDLAPGGVTPNDAGDVDTGPNDLLNFPVLEYAVPEGVGGYITGVAGESYIIDFYASGSCDPSGYGEGDSYLGSTIVTAQPDNQQSRFHATLPLVPDFMSITATATDAEGNTSEFSGCISSGYGIVVTSTANDGPGSLRQAILQGNAGPDMSVIRFAIPGDGPHTITPWSGSDFPDITNPVVIDGFSQPGASPNTNAIDQPSNAVLKIVLAGNLEIHAEGCLLRGLCMSDPVASATWLGLFSDSNRIEGCYFGTDPSGLVGVGGGYIAAYENHNKIGGLTPDCRNIISGWIGYAPAMTLYGNSSVLQGNFIGLDATGSVVLAYWGLSLQGSSNLVGGTVVESRNVIAGYERGITVTSIGTANKVLGNFIGLDCTGMMEVPEYPSPYGIGVYLEESSGNVIGGPAPGARNVIVAAIGVAIHSSEDNLIRGNYIGTNAAGATLPGWHRVTGVRLAGLGEYPDPANNWIGGDAPETGNLIAGYSTGIDAALGQSNRMLQNTIKGSASLGIDLQPAGVTPNDPGDTDTGPNNLQNFPVLTQAISQSGGTDVSGTLDSSPSTQFRLEFFSNAACHASGHGEGEMYLGHASVTTNSSGVASFVTSLAAVAPPGSNLTATATDPAGNTSEFAACVEVLNTGAGSNVQVEVSDGGVEATLTFENITVPGNTSLNTTTSCAELPGTFLGPDSLCYDITTTATFSGTVEVCFGYDEGSLAGSEGNVRLIHYDATLPAWVDITTSVDTDANRVCGETSTLSPFVIGTGSVTAVGPAPLPKTFALHPNVPNPFNPTTVIGYDVAVTGTPVSIRLYDVAGRLVKTLVDEPRPAGMHRVTWDGRNGRGEPVATGVYFYRMQAGTFVQTRKMVLLK